MRASTDIARPSVVKLSAQIEQDKKDHDKRIKIIEVCNVCLIINFVNLLHHIFKQTREVLKMEFTF